MRFLIALPFLIVLVLFALSNTTAVQLGLWPTDYAVELPLSIAILIAMAIAFVAGGCLVWVSALGQRRRARRAERAVGQLEAQVQQLTARSPSTALPPPVS